MADLRMVEDSQARPGYTGPQSTVVRTGTTAQRGVSPRITRTSRAMNMRILLVEDDPII